VYTVITVLTNECTQLSFNS